MVIESAAMRQQSGSGYEEIFWQAVLHRNPSFNGLLFYGVRSTGIYCRPTCPSRKPQRHRVCFFNSAQNAEAAGYRPCKRCHPDQSTVPNATTAKVLTVCHYIEAHIEHIPTLAELGVQVEMSPSHLQRTFKQVIGVTEFWQESPRL